MSICPCCLYTCLHLQSAHLRTAYQRAGSIVQVDEPVNKALSMLLNHYCDVVSCSGAGNLYEYVVVALKVFPFSAISPTPRRHEWGEPSCDRSILCAVQKRGNRQSSGQSSETLGDCVCRREPSTCAVFRGIDLVHPQQ
jgi:hypothetical protein